MLVCGKLEEDIFGDAFKTVTKILGKKSPAISREMLEKESGSCSSQVLKLVADFNIGGL